MTENQQDTQNPQLAKIKLRFNSNYSFSTCNICDKETNNKVISFNGGKEYQTICVECEETNIG